MQAERWKDIVGYEAYYQVSNLGRSKDKHSAYQRFYNAYFNHYGVIPW